MEHAFLFSIIITIKLGLMAGLVAWFDTLHMKDKQSVSRIKYVYSDEALRGFRAQADKSELYDGIR